MVTFFHSSQNNLIRSGYKALQRDQALASCIQSLMSKNAIERVEIVKSLGFYSCLFLVPKPHQRWRPVIDLSRLNTFLLVERLKNGNTRVHQDLSDSRGMGIVDRLIRCLPSHPHPPKLKEVPKVLPHVSGVLVRLSSLWVGHGPTGLYNDCKRSEVDDPVKGNQTSQVPGRLAYQGPVSERSTSEHSDSGRPDSVLRVDNKSGEIRTKAYSSVFIRGLRIPSRFSPCKTHSREMAQSSRFDPMTQVKTCFDCKMFDVANWVTYLNGENDPGGTPSHEALSVSPQGALEISSVIGQPPSLDRIHFSTPRVVWKIMTWCHHYQIILKARHIPGCLNVMADLLSRLNQVQSTEWSLHLQVFKQICLKWFTPHVDLFATRLNHKVASRDGIQFHRVSLKSYV